MDAVLHVVSDKQRSRLPLAAALLAAAEGGADVIQIREKRAPALDTFALVADLQKSLVHAGLNTKMFVNDRVDIALAAPTDGVHLAARSLPIPSVVALRAKAGWTGRIGCSVHSLEEAVAAAAAGADYVTFGHIFASESHPGLPPRGPMALRRIVDALAIPVIAIGGIDRSNVESVLDTGCSGVAVIGAVLDHPNPAERCRALKERMRCVSSTPKVPFFRDEE